MTLTVRRLATECRVPRTLDRVAAMADRVARDRLPGELGARLGPSLDPIEGIVRVRRLPLRVALPAAGLDEATLVAAWAKTFVRRLFQALACPSGVGPFQIARYASRADELAALVRDALAGIAAQAWQYVSFRSSGVIEDPRRVFDLCESASALRELLDALARCSRSSAQTASMHSSVDSSIDDRAEVSEGALSSSATLCGAWVEHDSVLDALLLHLDDLALERLFIRLSQIGPATGELTIDDVLEAMAVAMRIAGGGTNALRRWERSGDTRDTCVRRLALRAWVVAQRTDDAIASTRTPRTFFYGLLAAVQLVESPSLVTRARESIEQITGRRVPAAVEGFFATLRRDGVIPPSLREAIVRFAESHVAPEIVAAAKEDEEATWITSDVAAIFLLAPLVVRLGWMRLRREMGSREFSTLLLEVAERIAGHEDRDNVDPAVRLFAGVEIADAFPTDASELAEEMVAEILTEFRLCIRGFRNASRDAIARQFLRKPGRIRVDERRITVVLDRSPYHIALHIAGLDEPVAELEWIGGRSLELVLEGL